MKDGQFEHEINARDELNDPANGIDSAPYQMKEMAVPGVGAKFQTCKPNQELVRKKKEKISIIIMAAKSKDMSYRPAK